MFKTVTTLTALLALFLLAFAPLVLAQQEDETLLGETEPALVPPEDPPGKTAPAITPPAETPLGETEPTIAPPEEDPPAQDSHPDEAPGSPFDLENPVSLVSDKIVIDCVVVFQNLAQLEQQRDAQASDPAFQLELAQTEDFAQLCLDSGFTTPGGDAAPDPPGSEDNADSE